MAQGYGSHLAENVIIIIIAAAENGSYIWPMERTGLIKRVCGTV
jgi:hypothetical protein